MDNKDVLNAVVPEDGSKAGALLMAFSYSLKHQLRQTDAKADMYQDRLT